MSAHAEVRCWWEAARDRLLCLPANVSCGSGVHKGIAEWTEVPGCQDTDAWPKLSLACNSNVQEKGCCPYSRRD